MVSFEGSSRSPRAPQPGIAGPALDEARSTDSTPALRARGGKPMAVDIKKLFNQDLPAALAKNSEEAKAIGATYQLNVTGPSGGEWQIDVSATGPSCKPGTGPADCTITITD